MNKKMMCISIAGLLLLCGFNCLTITAKTIDQDTEDLVSDVSDSKISAYGFFRVNVKIKPDDSIKNKGYKYKINIYYDDEEHPEFKWGTIKNKAVTYKSVMLFYVRRDLGLIYGREGDIKIEVSILQPDPYNPGWYETVHTKNFSANFIGPFISGYKEI